MNSKHIIVTRSGKVMEFGNFRVEDINIEDIAWALSNLCRFTGHTSTFYSVAQHLILCSQCLDGTPTEKLQALLHDAAEAYINDLSSPLKAHIRGRYMELHEDIDKKVAQRFGLTELMTPKVKLVDQIALIYEWEAFFPQISREESKALGFNMSLSGQWDNWTPKQFSEDCKDTRPISAYTAFLNNFNKLIRRIEQEKDPCPQRWHATD